jgi:hypothetical protein
MSSDDKTGWQGMRTVAQIRKDRGLEIPLNKDSLYKVSHSLNLLSVFQRRQIALVPRLEKTHELVHVFSIVNCPSFLLLFHLVISTMQL